MISLELGSPKKSKIGVLDVFLDFCDYGLLSLDFHLGPKTRVQASWGHQLGIPQLAQVSRSHFT